VIGPIDLESLPRVGAREAALGRAAAWALAALPSAAEVAVAALGPVVLRYAGLDDRGPAAAAEQVAFGLARARGAGRILVPVTFARKLLAAALGSGEPPAPRRLGTGERGLLAGLLASVIDGLGGDLSLSLLSPPALASSPLIDGALRIAIDVATAAATGRVALEIPPEWIRDATDETRWRERARALPVTVGLELARTSLRRGELAALEVGDGVVFDGCAAVAATPGVPWPLALGIGDHETRATCSADGGIRLEGAFRRVRAPAARLLGSGQKEKTMERPPATIDSAAVLAAAPVEVIAELGRLTLRGEEVLALAPGVVIALGGARPSAVALRVGGEIWAEGELVNVDGELAVRVTALRRPLDGAPGSGG
jgi:type III secretion system YscQ/HrcQ family protein